MLTKEKTEEKSKIKNDTERDDNGLKEQIRSISFFLLCVIMIVFLLITQVYTKREEEKTVSVHIKGEVKAPGYYELKSGERIVDAVELAGGVTDNADLDSVNLAQKLLDGEEIIIQRKGQTAQNSSAGAEAISEESVELININTADMYALCSLDGIGESYAQKIINYRKTNGEFKSKEEIMNIRGIGKVLFENIKNHITV